MRKSLWVVLVALTLLPLAGCWHRRCNQRADPCCPPGATLPPGGGLPPAGVAPIIPAPPG